MHEIILYDSVSCMECKSWKMMWDDVRVHVFMSNKCLNCLRNIDKHILNILKCECDVWLGVMQEMYRLRNLR
jgi:hypothetical protein